MVKTVKKITNPKRKERIKAYSVKVKKICENKKKKKENSEPRTILKKRKLNFTLIYLFIMVLTHCFHSSFPFSFFFYTHNLIYLRWQCRR